MIRGGCGPFVRALAPFPDVVFAYLFGSLARGRPSPLSDVDVAVYLEKGADLASRRLEILGALARHLGTDEIDVVVLNGAPIALARRVLSQRHVVVDELADVAALTAERPEALEVLVIAIHRVGDGHADPRQGVSLPAACR